MSVLSQREKEQAAKYLSNEAGAMFVTGRSGIRLAVSRYLGVAPGGIRIEIDGNGKPFLPAAGIQFNLSHSGSVVVAAISRHPVGIDIETRNRCREFVEVARRFFHPDEADAISNAGDEAQFLRLWTGKEAMLKLSGEGLAGGLKEAWPGRDGIGMLRGREVHLKEFALENCVGCLASFEAIEVKGWFQI